MFIYSNPNPFGQHIGDCVIRAVAIAEGLTWDDTYIQVMLEGFRLKDLPSSNYVWHSYLLSLGYKRHAIPNTCPECYTIKDFCRDFPNEVYIVGTGSHVVTIIDGDYYDTWDSGDEIPIYYFRR